MKFNMKINKTLTLCSALLTFGLAAQAQNDISAGQSSTVSAWTGTPVFETGPAPTTGSGGTSNDNDNWGGNADGTAGFGAIGESFEVTSAGTLSTAQLILTGG